MTLYAVFTTDAYICTTGLPEAVNPQRCQKSLSVFSDFRETWSVASKGSLNQMKTLFEVELSKSKRKTEVYVHKLIQNDFHSLH